MFSSSEAAGLHLQAFSRFYAELPAPKRLIGYSKFAEDVYWAPNLYRPGDWLMFGAETSGLPQEVTHLGSLSHTAPSRWCADATTDVTACVSTGDRPFSGQNDATILLSIPGATAGEGCNRCLCEDPHGGDSCAQPQPSNQCWHRPV